MSYIRIEGLLAPHAGQPIYLTGTPLHTASAAMVMIHGRGASAQSILSLAKEFQAPAFIYIAPQAAGNTWYPNSFLTPIQSNEPNLSSALALIDALMEKLAGADIPPDQVILLGFSQGACLALEYAARHARRYAGVVGLSGGLIGEPRRFAGTPAVMPREYTGDFAKTPIFLGCSDVDPHIPRERVEESTAILERMGAAVTMRLYKGMGHTINEDEIAFVRQLVADAPAQ